MGTRKKKDDLSTSFKKLMEATEGLPCDSSLGSVVRERVRNSDLLKIMSVMKNFPGTQINHLIDENQEVLNKRKWNPEILVLILENHFDKMVSTNAGASGEKDDGADEGAEDDASPSADDGGEDDEEDAIGTTGWISSLREISPVDKIINDHRETAVIKTATNVQENAIAGKMALAKGVKKAASVVRIATGQTLLDKVVEEAIKRNPDSVFLKFLASFVDISYRIIMMALAAFFVISRPDKAIKKILGDDIVDNLPAS